MTENRVPTELVDLPSKGLLYNENSELNKGVIELKYLTAKDEDILTSRKLIQSGEIFKVLLKNIIASDVKYDDILVFDRDAILIMARIMAYGSNYEFKQPCPNCGEPNHKQVDLQSFNFKEIDEDFLSKSKNEFVFTLPQSQIEITFKLLTVKDHDDIVQEVNNMSKVGKKSGNAPQGINTKIDRTSSTALVHTIKSVNGKTDRKEIDNFVRNQMLLQDIRALRKYMDEISPGIDTVYNFDCDECGFEEEMEVNIDRNFFWPKT